MKREPGPTPRGIGVLAPAAAVLVLAAPALGQVQGQLYEIGRGSDSHRHRATDVLSTFPDSACRLGFNATQTTFTAVAPLAETRVVVLPE